MHICCCRVPVLPPTLGELQVLHELQDALSREHTDAPGIRATHQQASHPPMPLLAHLQTQRGHPPIHPPTSWPSCQPSWSTEKLPVVTTDLWSSHFFTPLFKCPQSGHIPISLKGLSVYPPSLLGWTITSTRSFAPLRCSHFLPRAPSQLTHHQRRRQA